MSTPEKIDRSAVANPGGPEGPPLTRFAPPGAPARRRTYVGLRISFDVTIAVPGAAPFTLPPIEVEPPDTFEVEFMAPAGFAAAAGAMPDDDVYETMITRAFDHLDRALGRTLVGAAPAIR